MLPVIRTQNMEIDPELCSRLDKAIFSTKEKPPQIAIDKYNLYLSELLEYLRTHTDEKTYAILLKHKGLYYLCGVASRIILDESAHVNERMHANAHTAHEQLKNWK